MSQFWLYASGLALFAVFFVIWPLWRRSDGVNGGDRQAFVLDLFNENRKELEEQRASGEITEEEYTQLMTELESALLEDSVEASSSGSVEVKWPLYVFAVLVVVGSALFYQQRGALEDISIQELMQQRFEQQLASMRSGEVPDESVTEELIQKLQARVAAHPDRLENRYLLARLAAQDARYGLAIQHYTAVLQSLEKPDPKMMAELAQVVFLASGSRVTPEVSVLVEKILELNPNESTALGLAGIQAFEQAQYQGAIDYWKSAIRQLPANSPVVRGLMGGVQRAQAMLKRQDGVDGSEEAAEIKSAQGADPAVDSVSVSVVLADGVSVPGDAFVMVFAREWGGRMPLAISRFKASELPQTVSLNKAMSMMPGVDITTVSQLEVVARVSVSGGAVPQSGDWQVSKGPIVLSEAAEGISLIVSEQLP